MNLYGDGWAPAVLMAVLEQAKEGVLLTDETGLVRFLNLSAEHLCHRHRADLLGQPVISIWKDSGDARADAVAEYLAGRGMEIPDRLQLRDAEGRHSVELSHSRIAAAGTTWHLFLLRDVTDAWRRERCRNQLIAATDAARQAVIAVDAGGGIVHASPLVQTWLGYSQDELAGMNWRRLLAPGRDNRGAWRRLSMARDDTESRYEELRVRHRHGGSFWLSGKASRVREEDGGQGDHVALLVRRPDGGRLRALQVEVLERSICRHSLDEILNLICWRIDGLIADVATGVVLIDDAGRMKTVIGPGLPAAYKQVMQGVSIRSPNAGAGLAAYRAQSQWTVDIRHAPEWANRNESLAASGLDSCWSLPVRLGDGRIVGVLCLHSPHLPLPTVWHRHVAEMGTEMCALAVERDCLRRETPQALRTRQAQTAVWWQIDRVIAQAAIDSAPLAFILANMDRFWQVNERLGRPAGDRLLEVVAERFHEQVRTLDLVSHLGADEFVVVVPDCDAVRARALVMRLVGALEKPIRFEGRMLQLSASFGISLYPQDGRDGEMLHQQATAAMGRVKLAGGDGYRFYSLLS
ncbi:MAG: diguanylate cyclase [Xanthomonadaceae bacterium]|jgi:diguanylate cyclase (GGDEF)-like protein/PAS domain S-box-containing protein|nr:diguanylate cyclase [Xanthomonadaceae bacterium]